MRCLDFSILVITHKIRFEWRAAISQITASEWASSKYNYKLNQLDSQLSPWSYGFPKFSYNFCRWYLRTVNRSQCYNCSHKVTVAISCLVGVELDHKWVVPLLYAYIPFNHRSLTQITQMLDMSCKVWKWNKDGQVPSFCQQLWYCVWDHHTH